MNAEPDTVLTRPAADDCCARAGTADTSISARTATEHRTRRVIRPPGGLTADSRRSAKSSPQMRHFLTKVALPAANFVKIPYIFSASRESAAGVPLCDCPPANRPLMYRNDSGGPE